MTRVKIYTLKRCTYCPILKKMLKDKGVEYEEVDIANAETMSYLFSKDPGIVSAPVLEIDGKLYIYKKVDTDDILEKILRLHGVLE